MTQSIDDLIFDYKIYFNSGNGSQNATSFLLRLLKIPHETEYRPKNQKTKRKSRFDIIVGLGSKKYVIIENKFRKKTKSQDRAVNQLTRYSEFGFPVIAIYNNASMRKGIQLIMEMMENHDIHDSNRGMINLLDHRGRIRPDQLII